MGSGPAMPLAASMASILAPNLLDSDSTVSPSTPT
uniref:Uncharacterized protein n=1 Tax=Arundo donax TaxID=35708 RepID=A0A0A9G865_ARUDO